MTPGKLLYKLYHKPIQVLRDTFKTGIKRTAEINAGKKQMMMAAANLQEVVYSVAPRFDVYFLTGKKYWFQTAFCLHSLQQNAGINVHAFIIDDGSFDEELERTVGKQFPTTATVVRSTEINRLLDEKIPEQNFPILRQRRLVYPHLRKLTDVHVLPGEGPKLVLDSDMLFFHRPVELLSWFLNSDTLIFMRDVTESYGYSVELMKKLTGVEEFPDRLNVGIAGIPSRVINWHQLECWTAELLQKEGSSYLQEQALTAMIAANVPHTFLDETKYKVLPTIVGANIPETLHHYVADAKYDYFVRGWKFFINN